MGREWFHTFEIGEEGNEKTIQIERLTAYETIDMLVNLSKVWFKGGVASQLLENTILKGLKIDHQDNDIKDGNGMLTGEKRTDDLELYEYIDLLFEAIDFQVDFESLGKSRTLKKVGIDIGKGKEKFQQMMLKVSAEETKREEPSENSIEQ
jgi:hypothetical protein